jgi:anti-sigma factor RsiW
MDCEKLESALMDELYGELDELTRASVKRHVAGCARCAALLGGWQATRRVAVIPRVAPPLDLEQRIVAAAFAAMPVAAPREG